MKKNLLLALVISLFGVAALSLITPGAAMATAQAAEAPKSDEVKAEAPAAATVAAAPDMKKEGEKNMKTALLIIDVQNDYFPNGKMELHKSLDASLKIKDLLEQSRSKAMPVIHIQHISIWPGSTFFLPGTPGAEIHENVKPKAGEKVIVKNFPNSFRKTELEEYLRKNNISKLVIVGMMTHMCVDTTVRAAFDLGFESVLVGDCCATRDLSIGDKKILAEDVQTSFLAAINGVFAKVITKDEAIELLKKF